jgi:DNA-binding transcriptional MerR regulator
VSGQPGAGPEAAGPEAAGPEPAREDPFEGDPPADASGDAPGDSSGDAPGDSSGDASGDAGRVRPKKAPNAFRTISEVADDLHIPQHVLRFWETRFAQVKPLKRGGGRRYYRPDDIALLRRISDLLYIQGYTIKGVQRLLREGGGKLSDDIPPPAPEEQAGAASDGLGGPGAEPAGAAQSGSAPAGAAMPELPMPGLTIPPPPRPVQLSPAAARVRSEAEAERLRGVLADTLRALEELRALLG